MLILGCHFLVISVLRSDGLDSAFQIPGDIGLLNLEKNQSVREVLGAEEIKQKTSKEDR